MLGIDMEVDWTSGYATACAPSNSSSGDVERRYTESYVPGGRPSTGLVGSPPTPTDGGSTRACTFMSPFPRATSTGWESRDSPADLNPSNRRMQARMSGGVAEE
jgi:hypothetical protein